MRKPAVAGMFYPAQEKKLKEEVVKYLSDARKQKLDGKLKALIVPHAGYESSAPIAACAFKLLEKMPFKKVILIGPSHHVYFEGASIAAEDFITPLGVVRCGDVDPWLSPPIIKFPSAHLKEHSLEVQLPFLQGMLGDFEMFAIVLGEVDEEEVAKHIIEHLDVDTLVVISSDLSHYQPYKEAQNKDKESINHVLKSDLSDIDACGAAPIRVLIRVAKSLGWKPKLLDYRNSGDTAGDKSRVVGYAAIVYTK